MKTKLTKLEKYWILYDVGNSAFTLLLSTIFPIHFNSLSASAGLEEVDYLAYWGYTTSLATLIVALLGPALGTVADNRGYKKKLFAGSIAVGIVGLCVLWIPSSWLAFLAIFLLARVGYSVSLIFYDSMLTDVTEPGRMDQVSSYGYAWGYVGSCIPFVLSLVLALSYESLGLTIQTAMAAVFLLNALWWLGCSLPLLRNYRQTYYVEKPQRHVIRGSFRQLWQTLRKIREKKKIFLFLMAFFFYIDGVYTIIDMATAYGSALGLDTAGLLVALLVTQLVAFPSAVVFARLARSKDTGKLIRACILAYTAIAIFAIQLDRQWEFWLLAVCVGLFQGGIQALSRSYFAQIIPADHSGEFFGLFDICGKGASFLGTTLISVTAQITGSANSGVAILAVLFVIGFWLFSRVLRTE